MQTAKQIFLEALDIEGVEDQQRHLAAACGDDLELRARVESLLAASDDPQSYLDRPAIRPSLAATQLSEDDNDGDQELEEAGSQIGNYRLLQEIGRGGFGVVYMAEQLKPVRRTVALKIIKPGMDTREVIARFEAERQALALMNHPNIARVLDAGATASGRPYFVMELVKGVALTKFCDQNEFTTQQRLELFVSICQAIQHAHQKGVIHRDLKPSNIMVTLHDSRPVAKVIDFGISKAISQRLTEKTLFTRYGQMVGTPQYMSPEQAEMSGLDVDTRSDIYSLAVILYELLTGTTPLEVERLRKAGFAEMLRLIKEEESPRPSTRLSTLDDRLTVVCERRSTNQRQLSDLIRRELDWIVMKGIDKDRNRRYATASELAEDIQRHLDGEPVKACPPTFRYRVSKYARRNRTKLIFAGTVGAVLMIASVMGWWLLLEAQAERRRAEVANAQLREETARAVENEQQAEQNRRVAVNAQSALQQKLYDESVSTASTLIQADKLSEARRLLSQTAANLRGWEWHRLNSLVPSVDRVPIPGSRISSFALSPQGELCVIAQQDNTIQLFDLKKRQTVWRQQSEVPGPITVRFSPQGNFILATSHLGRRQAPASVELWSDEGHKVWSESSETEFYDVPSLSPDESKLLVCRGAGYPVKGVVRVIDTSTFGQLYREDVDGFALASFNRDGSRILFALATGWVARPTKIRCQDLSGGDPVWQVDHPTTALPCVDPRSGDVMVGTENHGFTIYDPDSGAVKGQILGGLPGVAGLPLFSPDASLLSSTSFHGHVAIWDWQKKQILQSFLRGGKQAPNFTADNRRYAIISGDMSAIEFSPVRNVSPDLALTRSAGQTLAFQVDGQHMLSFSRDGLLRRWDLVSGMEEAILGFHPNPSEAVIGPQGRYVAIGDQRGLKLVGVDGFKTIAEYSQPSRWWHAVTCNSDGSLVAASSDTGLRIVETDTFRSFVLDEPKEVVGIAFVGPSTIATVSDSGRVDLVDLDSRRVGLLREGIPTEQLRPVCWLPSSNRLALGVDSRVEIWDIDAGQSVATLGNKGALVTRVLGSIDETRLFVGDADGSIGVWSLDSMRQLTTLHGHQRGSAANDAILGVQTMLTTKNGNTLISGGRAGEICVWESSRPTAELFRNRTDIAAAAAVVDRLLMDSGDPQQVSGLIRDERSLSENVMRQALKIVVNRGQFLANVSVALRNRDLVVRFNLDSTWKDHVLVADSTLQRLHSEVERGLEQASGIDLSQDAGGIRQYTLGDCLRWSELANLVTALPLRRDQVQSVVSSLVRQHPDSPLCLHLQGMVSASQHRWDDAYESLSHAQGLASQDSPLRRLITMQLATLDLRAGSLETYHKACRRLLAQIDDNRDPRWRWRVARLCLASDNDQYSEQCAALIDGIDVQELPDDEVAWFYTTKAMLLIRQGSFERAFAAGEEAIERIVRGPTASYIRSSALFQMRVAAIEAGKGMDADGAFHRRNYVLAFQPFLNAETRAVHRSWEQWILHGAITGQ